MTDKNLPRSVDSTLYPLVSQERIDEVLRIFSSMGIHEPPSSDRDSHSLPRFKEISILKSHPYGIKISGRSEG